jgi:hypothetical protein
MSRALYGIRMLGICPLSALAEMNSSLLDSATVFQTANGKNEFILCLTRRFSNVAIEFSNDWKRGKELSAQGPKAREEAIVERNGTILFHKFYLQTEVHVSGYPVYDRELLHSGY